MRVRHRINPDVSFSVPAKSAHGPILECRVMDANSDQRRRVPNVQARWRIIMRSSAGASAAAGYLSSVSGTVFVSVVRNSSNLPIEESGTPDVANVTEYLQSLPGSKPLFLRKIVDPYTRRGASRTACRLLVRIDNGAHNLSIIEGGENDACFSF